MRPGCEDPGPLKPPPQSAPRLVCRTPQPAAGQRSGVGAAPLARVSTTQRACSTWCPFPHGKRTTPCPRWSITRQITHALSARLSAGVAEEGAGSRRFPGRPGRRSREPSSWCRTGMQRKPLAASCGTSPVAVLVLCPFYSPRSVGPRPARVRCAPSLALSPLPARFALSVAALPLASGCPLTEGLAPDWWRPCQQDWLLVMPSLIRPADLAYRLTPVHP